MDPDFRMIQSATELLVISGFNLLLK